MGCFGGSSNGFGCEWLIILAVLFFCFCNGDHGFFGGDDCDWLVWVAIILLLLFLCNREDECCD